MWPPPMFISFTVVWFLNIMLAVVVWKQSRVIRHMRRNVTEMYLRECAAIMFANALAERGVHIPCDDCGNPMTPDDAISIMERPTGGTYVGHRSHNRDQDWGLRGSL